MVRRKKSSVIWKITKEALQEICNNSSTIGEVLSKLGFANRGANSKTLKNRIIEDNINIDYICLNRFKNKNHGGFAKKPLKEILVEKSTYNRTLLKERLVSEKLVTYQCALCPLAGEWQGKSLSLQLDHINGLSNDNRLENLRFLCPNCHSQTDNFAGKSLKKQKPIVFQKEITKLVDDFKLRPRKCIRPNAEILSKMVWEKPTIEIGKSFGVSDQAITKWCKEYNIIKPPRGYWQKKKAGKI